MQDILDSGLDFLGLNNSNSRSASMKKIQRKDSQHQPQSPGANNSGVSKQSFGLADSKYLNNFDSSSANTTRRMNNQLSELHIDQKNSIKIPRNTNHSHEKISIGNSKSQADIFGEEHTISRHFQDAFKSNLNSSKNSEPFHSTRNMKPPLRPKDSWNSTSLNFGMNSANVVIPEQDHTLTNSSHENGIPSPRLVHRRSSIDARSQVSDSVFPIGGRTFTRGSSNRLYEDGVKEDPFDNIHRSQSCVIPEQKQDSDGITFFKAKDKLQSKSEALKVNKDEDIKKCSCDQKMNKRVENIMSDCEKQVDLLKKSYQKQMTYLQECLDQKVEENRKMRGQFMEETNGLLEKERSRSQKLHFEEIQRLKQMFQWQQKKQEEVYKLEIDSLKSSLGRYTEQQDKSSYEKKQNPKNQFLEFQLADKERRLQIKTKCLDKRELQIQTRESELNFRIRKEEDRLRAEERRLAQMESEIKKRSLEDKKSIMLEKEELAMQAGIQMSENMKIKEQLKIERKQVELEKKAIEQRNYNMEEINMRVVEAHRDKLKEIQDEKERLKQIEIDLIRKLQVISLKAKQTNVDFRTQDSASLKKHNLDNSFQNISKQKKLKTSDSYKTLLKTKERFNVLQKDVHNQSLKKQNRKLDLSGYITRMEKGHLRRL